MGGRGLAREGEGERERVCGWCGGDRSIHIAIAGMVWLVGWLEEKDGFFLVEVGWSGNGRRE